jgi:hypothetical protein
LPFTSSSDEPKSLHLVESLKFTKKRLGQVENFMKLHSLEELGVGAQEDYQILEIKLRKMEKKIAKVIDSGDDVAYINVKKKVEE